MCILDSFFEKTRTIQTLGKNITKFTLSQTHKRRKNKQINHTSRKPHKKTEKSRILYECFQETEAYQ